MSELLQSLGLRVSAVAEVPLWRAIPLLGNAILIGTVLMLVTWRANQRLFLEQARSAGDSVRVQATELVLSSSNVFFLCVGMCAIMILVNDSLARAFAIGAAIALVRFRIKVAGKFLSAALFFGVLAGMACGVSRADLAWAMTAIFCLSLAAVFQLRRYAARKVFLATSEPSVKPVGIASSDRS